MPAKTNKKQYSKSGKEKSVGKVTHFFGKIKVAVIKLSGPVKEGDTLHITGGEDTDFKQKVSSMQIDHKKVKLAKKGKSIGLKVSKQVRQGYKVFKI